jgi:hypothetical protein
MSLPRPAPDLGAPPVEFDRLVDWFDHVSRGLVLLEEYSLPDVTAAARRFEGGVRDHVREFAGRIEPATGVAAAPSDARSILRSDHAWFSVSIDQLEWFLGIVTRDDHGGHRQALGQYGRVFAEAVRRHRREEIAFLGDRREER